MSDKFVVTLMQKDLKTGKEKWLNLHLEKSRIVAAEAQLNPVKHRWLAMDNPNLYEMWGRWNEGPNSESSKPDQTLGVAQPSKRGWRYSHQMKTLYFVEFYQSAVGAPSEFRNAALLPDARPIRDAGYAPNGIDTAIGTGSVVIGSNFLHPGPVAWSWRRHS